MKMSKLLVYIVLFLIIIGGIFYLLRDDAIKLGEEISEQEDSDVKIPSSINPAEISGKVVQITEEGFSPDFVEINNGESVTFINKMSSKSWPASNAHPTHKDYPGSDIKKCFGDGKEEVFDACKGLSEGESYTFIFDESGEWKYHDHLSSRKMGVVLVK